MFSTFLRMGLAITAISSTGFAKDTMDPGKYQIDPMHSKMGFEVPHLVISSVEGSFKIFEGVIEVQPEFSKSKISASASIESIDTGVAKRDEHLKSADFFDAKNFPKLSFESKSIQGTPEAFVIGGELTIRGHKKSVQLTGKYLGAVTDGYGQRKIALQASTQISRKEFGLTWNSVVEAGPVVGDLVTISLKIQASRIEAKK
jgi:polyisoprenoid-binding protein YceI